MKTSMTHMPLMMNSYLMKMMMVQKRFLKL